MRESVGYTVTLNIMIIFIIVVLVFLSAALIYFKSNKVSNVVTDAVEKYEGYNSVSEDEISSKLSSLGYNVRSIKCATSVDVSKNNTKKCNLVRTNDNISYSEGQKGYCVYLCEEEDYYYYKIRTNMMLNIPIINNFLNIPIYSNTNRLYDFSKI